MNDIKQHPLYNEAMDANDLGRTLEEATNEYASLAMASEIANSKMREAEDILKRAINEVQLTAIMDGKAGMGPLNGIATSSKAYTLALEALSSEACSNNVKAQFDSFVRLRNKSEIVDSELEQARSRMISLRTVCELKAAVLNAFAS